jgi:hypothetical protein
MTALDTAGLDQYHPHRAYTVDGHTIHINHHTTRWKWELHTPNGTVVGHGYENTPGRAARFALHALQGVAA